MGAPVLLAHGTDEQRSRWLPRLARGEELWCQFFSEPDAGSDLASVQTRAVREGDGWVVNGQKVWNSATLLADRGILVARTDVDVPKHRGLSFFVIDVDQPGLDIRPIRQMNGRTEFNETFFTDARVADDSMIGAPGDGWRAAMTTLSNERNEFAGGWEHPLAIVAPGKKAGHLDRIVGDLLEDPDRDDIGEANTPPLHTPQHLIDLARRCDRANDPMIRERIARVRDVGGVGLDGGASRSCSRGRSAAGSGELDRLRGRCATAPTDSGSRCRDLGSGGLAHRLGRRVGGRRCDDCRHGAVSWHPGWERTDPDEHPR
jgi:hypothetical protein